MHPDLERLIQLQKLDTAAEDARRLMAIFPQRVEALEAQLDVVRRALAAARDRKAANDAARRELDKDLAAVRARRSKFQDQTMEVKTNREYHALQSEIQAADQQIRRLEDGILDNMLAADDIAATIKAAEGAQQETERAIASQRQALEQERQSAETSLTRIAVEREELVRQIAPAALAIFDTTARGRKGPAVAEVRDGLCTVCHVRVRPQIYQEVRRNDRIVQCESCTRILYYVPPAPAGASPA